MNKTHRLFLQCFLSKPFMLQQHAKDTYIKVLESCEGEWTPDNFNKFIATINRAMQSLFLEIRKGVSEDDGNVYYALVNDSNDQISKFATSYTALEVEYFRKVMDLLVQSEDGTVTSVELLHCAHDLGRNMSASHAETAGDFWLGPRTVLELQSYLKRVYSDFIVNCKICMDIVLRGQNCVACDVKLHRHCAAKYFSRKTNKRCPECEMDWPHEIDENLALNQTDIDTSMVALTSQQTQNNSSRRKKTR